MMKKLTVALSVLAILGLAAPAMAQTDQDITVNIEVLEYAELSFVEGAEDINVLYSDSTDLGEKSPSEENFAQLNLQANYDTRLLLEAEETLQEGATGGNNRMLLTSVDNSEDVVGAWPVIRVNPDTSDWGNWYNNPDGHYNGWDESERRVLTELIEAGEHLIAVTVQGQMDRTTDGEWAAPGNYTGTAFLTVVNADYSDQ